MNTQQIITHICWGICVVCWCFIAYFRGKTKVYREWEKHNMERVAEISERLDLLEKRKK